MYKEIKSLSIPFLLFCSSSVFAASFPSQQSPELSTDQTQEPTPDPGQTGQPAEAELEELPIAANDHATIVPNKISVVEGDVVTNDQNGNYVELTSYPVSEYGFLVLNSDGTFTYTLYTNAASVTDLKVGDVVTDVFSYAYIASSGHSATASLNIQIIGNPVDADGNTVFQAPVDEPYDNVDVEFNNRSAQATPLNSGRNIKGHLHHSGDKDWYKLASSGNEIISLEVCPQGSGCFGKKSWVLYVFDSDKLTQEMEEQRYTFSRWLDDTGSSIDESDSQIITGTNGSSNHMYLNYRAGTFDGALIGVVDPCFDTSNTVDIGVGDGARNYLVAISSPLKGDSGDAESCGGGSVVLNEPGLNVMGQAPEGTTDKTGTADTIINVNNGGEEEKKDEEDNNVKYKPKKYSTTQEFISVFPKSDDQYSIKITGTGLHPLLSEEAKAKSATYELNLGELTIPKVRVFDQLYSADLSLEKPVARSANKSNNLKFGISNLNLLNTEEGNDAFQATYNPENQQVIVPRVTDLTNDNAYSVIMQYHPATGNSSQWLEVINHKLIQ